jgi:hypothetical protein
MGREDLVGEYNGKFYAFAHEEALQNFLRYVRLTTSSVDELIQ